VLKRIDAVEALRSEASDGAPLVTAEPLLNDYGGIDRKIAPHRKGVLPISIQSVYSFWIFRFP